MLPEYVNPLAGLAMAIIGIALISTGNLIYGGPPLAVGIILVLYYRKLLFETLGFS